MTAVPSARVLNVDDDEANRYAKARILKVAGYEVIDADCGIEALRLLREHRPALVLLDVRLPDIDGRELCRRIKADPETAETMVLQTSALHVDLHDRVASLDAGADGYLVEPMEPEELVATVHALLRMHRAEAERSEALQALRDADRRKDEFLAMLAHELRNPMAPIRNAVEILKSGDAGIRERARLMVGRQIEHLARLVDDLLEVSRITQGKVALQKAVVSVETLVQGAIEVVRPMAEARGQRIVATLPAAPLWIEGDPVRLTQVLGNLLNNALKFSESGGEVSLAVASTAEGIELRVGDRGSGIPAAVLPHVFDLFTQAESSLDRSRGGLGIGLALVKNLVEMHGGTVAATSAGEGRGSLFIVRLPASCLREAPAPGPSAAPSESGPRRILVVEDNLDAAETMMMLLEADGHHVSVVHDGAVALERARELRPDTILLDIGLPGINGFVLAALLRQQPETRSARLIAVSGYGQAKDRERSAAAGFDLHLVKPVDPARLRQALATT